jgi:coenzyme F420 hydrogenase subunit beta
MKEVINPGFCLGCGACVASCPFSVLAMVDERPKLVGKCELCGICYFQCPQLVNQRKLESRVFGRNVTAAETIGINQRAVSVQTSDHEIRTRCQDGGAVTSLLASLLEAGFIDGAVVTASDGWRPVPKVATARAELLECAGSKYSRGEVLLGLRDAIDLYSCERIAVVGLPCQIKAVRRMQTSELAAYRLTDAIKLCIGLFCAKAFPYERFFKNVIEGQLNIKLAEVAKFDIKKGRFLIYRRRKPRRELALDALEQFMDVPCKLCPDFAAELADISIGAVGSPLDRSTVLLRTRVGVEAFELAERAKAFDVREIEAVKPGIKVVKRLSTSKKRAAREEIERRRKLGKPLPPRLQEQ